MKSTFLTVWHLARRICRLWPFSFFGSLNLAFAALLWVLSASAGNHAGIMLSVFLLAVLSLSVVSTHFAHGTRRAAEGSWSRNATLHEGENPQAIHVASAARRRAFPFTRMHLSLSGYISSAGRRLYRVSFECRMPEGGELDASLALPASGILSLRGCYIVRDALGLSRKRIGHGECLEAPVLPRLGRMIDVRVEESVSSASRNSLDRKNESEKIFVREYAQGDLARDINWKALARTGALLTRIPPESPREDRFDLLVLRLPSCASARGFVELDHVRALASAFLESVRMIAGDYGFIIRSDSAEFRVAPGEGLDAGKEFLAGLGFASGNADVEGAWVIGTGSDRSLQDWLSRHPDSCAGALLSRCVGLARSADHSVSLLSAGPRAFALPLLYPALFSVRSSRRSESSPHSPLVSEFRCGVRP
jgi:hypothetical protein